jgi:hypothetical protein
MKKTTFFITNLHGKGKGFINEFIALPVAVFFLIVSFLLCIEPLKKNTIHNEVFDLTNMALQRCEADGGLTVGTENYVLAQATKYNLDPNAISFVCKVNGVVTTPLLSAVTYPSDSSTYGSDVTLTVNYTYPYHEMNLVGFTASSGALKTANLGATLSTTTKN